MRKLLYILLACLAVSGACGGTVAQTSARTEQAMAQPSALGGEGCITFAAGDNDATFNVYAITGQVVKVVRVNAGQRVTVEMPRGFYIVRCNNQWSRKVIVR